MSNRPQSVAEFPATSCSFCCTASGALLEGAALDELGGGVAALLQAVKKHAAMNAKKRRFFIRWNCKCPRHPGKSAEVLFAACWPWGQPPSAVQRVRSRAAVSSLFS